MTADRRWVVVASDGGHVTVGRATDPSAEDLQHLSAGLLEQGVGGWLAVAEGDYYGSGSYRLMMVRDMAPSSTSWDDAVARFMEIRRLSTAT